MSERNAGVPAHPGGGATPDVIGAGSGSVWAIVLAAGDGRRLGALTAGEGGLPVPKQFCSLEGGPSLLQTTLRRASGIAPRDRIVVVVSSSHRDLWLAELAGHPPENVVVQPMNRGTGAGVLLPLLLVLRRDPGARVVLLPSDHHVEDERLLLSSLRRALGVLCTDPHRIVLLGMAPEGPDSEYGWIVPGAEVAAAGGGLRTVSRFVEKPHRGAALDLMRRGGLLNSFLVAAHGRMLLELYVGRLPGLAARMRGIVQGREARDERARRLAELYAGLESADFSRDLLQGAEDRLAVLAVPHCGWTDLGTPARLAECLSRRAACAGLAARATREGQRRLDIALRRHAQATA